jgi:hypothetical protein
MKLNGHRTFLLVDDKMQLLDDYALIGNSRAEELPNPDFSELAHLTKLLYYSEITQN